MKQILFICLALILAAAPLRADTIVFHNGEELDGTIIEKDDTMIKVAVEFGTVLVPMTRVRRIEADTPQRIEEREKKKAEAAEFAKKMKEDGKILYKGKWVTEEEKTADEEKIAEAKKKKKEAEAAAKKKAEEAAAKAKADAELAAQQNNNNNNNGNGRSDRFSRRHNRDDLNNDPFNSTNNNSNNNSINNNYNSIINNNGYRGR